MEERKIIHPFPYTSIELHRSPIKVKGHENPQMQEAIILATAVSDEAVKNIEIQRCAATILQEIRNRTQDPMEGLLAIKKCLTQASKNLENASTWVEKLISHVANYPTLKLLTETKNLLETAKEDESAARKAATSIEQIILSETQTTMYYHLSLKVNQLRNELAEGMAKVEKLKKELEETEKSRDIFAPPEEFRDIFTPSASAPAAPVTSAAAPAAPRIEPARPAPPEIADSKRS